MKKSKSIIAGILTSLIASSGAFLLWSHAHASELQLDNRDSILILVASNRTGLDIRRLDKEVHGLNMTIARIQDHLTKITLSGNKDPVILELEIRLKIEMEGYQEELDQKKKRLHDEQTRESALIERISTV